MYNSIIKLYNQLIKIYKQVEYDTDYYRKMLINYNLLNSNVLIKQENWIEATKCIDNVLNYITEIFNNNKKINAYNINLAFIAINELQNTLGMQNYNIFYTKYKIAIERIENI